MRRGIALVLPAMLTTGCYTSTPLSTAAPPPGTRIVATLTPDASVELADQIGSGVVGVEALTGVTGSEEWELYVIRVGDASGRFIAWNRERIMIPRSALASVRERRLNQTRSVLAMVGTTALAVLLGQAFGLGGAPGSGSGGDSNPAPVH